jgi:nickel-dependent lactate racemase
LDRVTLINHDARDPDSLVNMGALSTGNVFYLNKNVAMADFVISFGDITPHAFAGFSGGRKAILPGVSGFSTIERNHTLVSHVNTGLGKLAGNLLHQEMIEAADRAPLNFIINFVRNSSGEIVAIVSGEHHQAFLEGANICREINSVMISERSDVVFVSCGGFPKDKCLYHAQRAIIAAVNAVRKGGTIILFGQFPEGVGDELYEIWLQKPLPEILALPPEQIKLGVHSAYLMARNLTWAEVVVFTDLDIDLATRLHYRKLDSLDAILEFIREKHGPSYSAFLIPNGSQMLVESPS